MAVSNQDIIDFLLANPGMSDAEIASAMQTYNVTPAQMAAAVGLPVEEVQTRYNEAAPSVYTAENVNKLADQILSQGTTEKWTGGLPPEKAALYMADELAKSGVTDIAQVAKGDDGIINSMTGEKLISGYGERTGGNLWSGSYEGKGNTGFGVNFDESGKPVFYTTGASSSDTKDVARIIQAGLLLSGAGGALGGALGLTGAAASGVGTGLISAGTSAIGGANLKDALKTGLLSGGLAYGGNELANAIKYQDVPVDFNTMSNAEINQAIEDNFRNDLARAGLSSSQINSFIANPASIYNELATPYGAEQAVTTPSAVSTPVTDMGGVTVTAPVSTTPINSVASILSAVPSAGTVNVTSTTKPEQIDQSVLNLINSQLASNVGTPANLANVEVTSGKGMMSGGGTNTDILSTLAGLPTTPVTTTTPTQTITAQKPATTQDIVSAITATLPNVTPAQAATVAEQIITSGKPVTTQEVISAITAALPTVTTPTTTSTVPTQTITAEKPSSINDVITAATIPLIQPSTPLTPTPVKPTNPLGLTDDQLTNILKAGVGLLGGIGGAAVLTKPSTGTTVNPAGLPTQTPPMYTDDYFTKVQQNYNRLLPAVPRDVASPLRDWYTSQYGA